LCLHEDFWFNFFTKEVREQAAQIEREEERLLREKKNKHWLSALFINLNKRRKKSK